MSTPQTPGIRSYNDLVGNLAKRASAKKADSVPAAPEKDPTEKGKVTIPVDQQATPKAENLPTPGTNTDQTKATTLTPAKTVDGPEKAAGNKIAAITKDLKSLRANLAKSATAAEISTNGQLPSDKGSDNKNTPTSPSPGPDKHKSNSGTADPAVKDAGKDDGMATDPTKTTAPTPPKDSKGSLPADSKNKDDNKPAEKAAATDAEIFDVNQLDPAFAVKIASVICATAEGRAFAQQELERAEGAAQAEDIIKAAMVMEKAAARLMDEEHAGMTAAREFWEKATPEQRADMEKMASVHQAALESFETDFEKNAYQAGAADAAGMADAGMMDPAAAGAGGAPGADPSAGAGAPGAGDSGQISDQDIMQVLQHMIGTGELDEQTAQAILTQLQGGADPGAAAGGAGGAPDAGGAAPAPDAAGAAAPAPDAAPEPKKDAPKDDSGSDKEASAIIKQSSALAAELLAEVAKK